MFNRLRRVEARSAPDGNPIHYPPRHYRSPSLPLQFAFSHHRHHERRAEDQSVSQPHQRAIEENAPEIQLAHPPPPSSPSSEPPPSFCLQSCITFSPHLSISFPRLAPGPFYDGIRENPSSYPHPSLSPPHPYSSSANISSNSSSSSRTATYHTDGANDHHHPHIAWDTDLERGDSSVIIGAAAAEEIAAQPKPTEAAADDGAKKKKSKAAALWAAVRNKARSDPIAVAGVCAGIVVLPFVIRGSTR